MQALRVKMIAQQDGTLTLHDLPIHAGERVEVIILLEPPSAGASDTYSLRGQPITYIDPTAPVAQADWEAPE